MAHKNLLLDILQTRRESNKYEYTQFQNKFVCRLRFTVAGVVSVVNVRSVVSVIGVVSVVIVVTVVSIVDVSM